MQNEKVPFRKSIRTKLVIVSIVVEITMLGLLLANSLRLLNQTLEEQTQAKLEAISPLLDSALSARLFERDHAGIGEILDKLMKSQYTSFEYIVIYDTRGNIYAKSGKIDTHKMPAFDLNVSNTTSKGIYNSYTPLTLGNDKVGEVRFGLSMQSLIDSRDSLIRQGFFIASIEVMLTFILLSLGGYWLTRHILTLMSATRQVAAGKHDIQIPINSEDEIGRLASNFNAMTKAIHDRIVALHVSEQALFVEKERAEITLHSIGDGVMTTDTRGTVVNMNPVAEKLTGWSLSEAQEKPLAQIYRIIDTRSQQPAVNPVQYVLEHGDIVGLTEHTSLISRNGEVYQIEHSAAPLMNKTGEVSGVVLVFHNVTEQYRQQALIVAQEAELRKITDILPGPVTRVDCEGRYLFASAAFEKWFGKRPAEVIGLKRGETIDAELHGKMQPYYERALAGERVSFEITLPAISGGTRDAIIDVLPDFDSTGAVCGYYTVGVDISKLKHAEANLHHLAYYDSLTGLPNRQLFNDRLHHAAAECKRRGNFFALMLLDIDRFKNVNDTLGHEAGDKLLREISSRLQIGTREGDTIARLGGDEFTLIFPDLNDTQDVGRIAQGIVQQLSLPVFIDGHEVFTSGSVGITLYPQDTSDENSLVKFADSAMYHAKARGRNNYQFYSQEMTTHIQERMALETDMRGALEREEFFLHYQPQVDIATGQITGMEVLIRWCNTAGKNIAPDKFISLAEETGLIVHIGEWVMRTACKQLKAWNEAGYADLLLAVNVAARQFQDPLFVTTVNNILSASGISPQCLELEITEGILLQDSEETRSIFQQLKNAGVKLAIDDFGTGYSSLSYLKRFPIDRLKIDQSFVRDISTDVDDLAIVKAIIALGRSLKLQVIAEGVETATQLELLSSEGCHEYQGYYFSPPMDATALTVLLQASNQQQYPGPRGTSTQTNNT